MREIQKQRKGVEGDRVSQYPSNHAWPLEFDVSAAAIFSGKNDSSEILKRKIHGNQMMQLEFEDTEIFADIFEIVETKECDREKRK